MTCQEDWKKAGEIGAQALELAKTLVKKGTLLKEVANKVEEFIREKGAIPAFPVNISLNEVAAHYTPDANNKETFKEDLVKIDVGVCVNGAIGDTAATIDLSGKYDDMIKAVEEAREEAIKIIKPGVQLRKIGSVIEKTIKKYGFVPIKNLSGHGLSEYSIHSKFSIPNYDNGDERVIEEGDYVAIEPFATTGEGIVVESTHAEIFSLIKHKPIRDPVGREILKQMQIYKTLPVSTRYFNFPKFKIDLAIRTMKRLEMIHLYPVLIEKTKNPVAQAEHTLYVTNNNAIVLTKI